MLFAAVDVSRFTGWLQLLYGQPEYHAALNLVFSGRQLTGKLESDSTLTYLPNDTKLLLLSVPLRRGIIGLKL